MQSQLSRFRKRSVLKPVAVAAVLSVTLAGCATDEARRGFLPGYSDGEVTDHTARLTSLWVGTWVAALVVGLITWGLILWCVAVYRKRRDDHALPIQTRYHVPLEIMYTALPIILILGLFTATDRDMMAVTEVTDDEAEVIQVIGKQWSWDFNYVDADVYDTGVQINDVTTMTTEAMIDGAPGTSEELPTLWLPVNEKVRFQLDSRDVIHSFWIPAFLYKEDMIPYHTNWYEVTPTRVGTYAGKCAELCGQNHSGMLFNVRVVTRADYDAHMQDLRDAGQTGQLPLDMSRLQHPKSAEKGEQ